MEELIVVVFDRVERVRSLSLESKQTTRTRTKVSTEQIGDARTDPPMEKNPTSDEKTSIFRTQGKCNIILGFHNY